MRYLILLATFLFTVNTQAQIAKDFIFGGGIDLVKSDYQDFFNKMQIGLEANYYLTREFTASGGFELWVEDKASIAIGGRWYFIEEAFIRVRGLIGENDLNIGFGWTKPISHDLKFEAIADFYFEGDLAIRAGLVYVMRKEEQ